MMGRDYWDGLKTVAIVMVGEIIKGVYFNLSFWYKLTDRTIHLRDGLVEHDSAADNLTQTVLPSQDVAE